MITEPQEKRRGHPEGKIILADGRELECYPKAEKPSVLKKDEFSLDTTGEYLQIGKGRPDFLPRRQPAQRSQPMQCRPPRR